MAEIDRIAGETKSRLLLARDYRRRLAPSLAQALGTARQIIEEIPGPVALDPERWQTDMALRALFISPQEMRTWIETQKGVLQAADKAGEDGTLFALLLGRHHRHRMFITEQDGEIVRRDVPFEASMFEEMRLVAPAADPQTVRTEVIHRILQTVFLQALDGITQLKEDRERLEKEHELLEFVVHVAERDPSRDDATARAAADTLPEINRRLDALKRDVGSPEGQLGHIINALEDLASQVEMRQVTFHLNGTGTLVSTAPGKDSIGSCILAEYLFSGRKPHVALWVSLQHEAVMAS